jgi:hypothetical protein
MNPEPIIWWRLHWPRPIETVDATALFRRLAADASRRPVIFEVRVQEGEISYAVGSTAAQISELIILIYGIVQGVAFEKDPEHVQPPAVARMRLSQPSLSLMVDRPEETIQTILIALAAARHAGEQVALQIALGRGLTPRLSGPRPHDPTQSWLSALTNGVRVASPDAARSMKAKDTDLGFHALVRVGVKARTPERQATIIRGILASLRTAQTAGTRLDLVREKGALSDLPARGWQRLSVAELLGLCGLPLKGVEVDGLPAVHPRLMPLRRPDIEMSRTFGVTNAPGARRPVGISMNDALFHTIALGPTGSGKSTALLNLISDDMKAGRSVVVIDPKKDLVTDLLAQIPASRTDDVVILDPTQPLPVGLNPLIVPGTSPELIADGITKIFKDLFPNTFGPRMSDVLQAALLTLAHQEGASLTWLIPLLTDARFRRGLVEKVDPDTLGGFWEEYEGLSPRQQAQFIAPVLSRLRQFLLRPSLRRVLDQSQPRFDLVDIFTKPRILLVPINAGLLGNDAARLLGSLLVTQLWQLTLARAELPTASRRLVSIYVDEAQEFLRLGGDLEDALARSRSLGVAWHVAHQFRSQMPKETRAALDNNAKNKLVFRLEAEDAKAMASMAPGLEAEDFMSLPSYTAYTRLVRDGEQLDWVSVETAAPPTPTSDPLEIVAKSQARFGRVDRPAGEREPGTGTSEQRPQTRPTDVPIGRKRRTL